MSEIDFSWLTKLYLCKDVKKEKNLVAWLFKVSGFLHKYLGQFSLFFKIRCLTHSKNKQMQVAKKLIDVVTLVWNSLCNTETI